VNGVQYVAMLLALGGIGCASNNVKRGEADDLLDANGKKIGDVRQLTPIQQEFVLDRNQDGRPESKWSTENGEYKIFEKFDEATGKLRTRAYYLKGNLNRIEVFASVGSLRGIVNYPDGKIARSVELPRKGKLVEFMR